MSWLLETFIEIFRWLLWLITCIMYSIADLIYNVVHEIAAFDFLNDVPQVQTYYEWFMTAFLVFFIIFRLTKRYLKMIVDEQEAQQLDPLNIIIKIAAIGFLIIFLPKILHYFGTFVSKLVDNIAVQFSGNADGSFSDLVLEALAPRVNEMVKNKEVASLYDVDINAGGYGNYEVCNDWATFICLLGGSIFGSYILLLIGVQIGGRFLSMAMKLILAPYSISSLVDEKNDSFTTWWKLFIADFLANYMQILLLVIGSTLFLNVPLNGFAKIIAYVGALFGILNAPSGVSQLIGADIGVTSALQSMQTTMMGLGMAKSLGSVVGGVAKTAAGGALLAGGRTLGLSSKGSQIASGLKEGFKELGGKNLSFNESGGGGASFLEKQDATIGDQVGSGAGLFADAKAAGGLSKMTLGDKLDSLKNGGLVNVGALAREATKEMKSPSEYLHGVGGGTGFKASASNLIKAGGSFLYGKGRNGLSNTFKNIQHGNKNKMSASPNNLSSMMNNPAMYNATYSDPTKPV